MRHLILGLFLTMFATAASAESYKGYEMPPFTVVDRQQSYELRDYAPHLLATVSMPGNVRASASSGFRTLAGYIFGRNATGEKIAMTVPVQQVPIGKAYEISFMMPARFDQSQLPAPTSGAIRFRETSAERLAVTEFSGYATGAVLRRKAAELRDALTRDGLTILDGPRYAYYDDPFTLPWRRRNEVAFVVAE
ncbi:MAG: heme-binding protein [Pseudomonadota bacterium]